jgi:hypothetical protein
LITIPWVQSDLRREKKAWAENRGQGGIRYVDDITAPTARTRFASVQEALPNLLPWVREKQAPPSAPFAEGAVGTTPAHKAESMPDSTPEATSAGNSPGPASTTRDGGDETARPSGEAQDSAVTEPANTNTSSTDEKK